MEEQNEKLVKIPKDMIIKGSKSVNEIIKNKILKLATNIAGTVMKNKGKQDYTWKVKRDYILGFQGFTQ